jgi:undecaprenyl pyrophosphate phosphatase UppP
LIVRRGDRLHGLGPRRRPEPARLRDLVPAGLGDPQAEEKKNIVLNLTLHVGTLAAILVVYRKDLWGIWRRPKLCLAIVLATIPAAVAGVVLKKHIEATFEMPIVVACGWLVTAGLLWYGQRLGHGIRRPGRT